MRKKNRIEDVRSIINDRRTEYKDAYKDTGYWDGSSDYADSNYYDLTEPDNADGMIKKQGKRKLKKSSRVEDVRAEINKIIAEYKDAYKDTGYWDGSSDYADSNYYDLTEPENKVYRKLKKK